MEIDKTIDIILGAAIAFSSSYLLELRKLKNDKFKFSLDKTITVGEEYYKFSTYSLMYFTSIIDTMDKREEYLSAEAHGALEEFDKVYEKQMDKIRENHIVISTASIYFDVTDSENAVAKMLDLKNAFIKMIHGHATENYDLEQEGNEEYRLAISLMTNQIKADQLAITTKIKELVSVK